MHWMDEKQQGLEKLGYTKKEARAIGPYNELSDKDVTSKRMKKVVKKAVKFSQIGDEVKDKLKEAYKLHLELGEEYDEGYITDVWFLSECISTDCTLFSQVVKPNEDLLAEAEDDNWMMDIDKKLKKEWKKQKRKKVKSEFKRAKQELKKLKETK